MIPIHPKKLDGPWNKGFALDDHTLRSDYIGADEFGHPRFDTRRSEMGELLYQLKFKANRAVLKAIVRTVCDFIRSHDLPADLVVPVPPSNKDRPVCPPLEVAEGVGASLGIPVCSDCIVKVKQTPELKDVYDRSERLTLLKGAYRASRADLAGKRVLLFDDLYRSGATLSAVANALRTEGGAKEVYALTLTRTRRLR